MNFPKQMTQGAVTDGNLSIVLKAGVIEPLVAHLQSKGPAPCSSVTVDELISVLGLPSKPSGGLPTGSVGVAPASNPLMGTGAAPASKSKKKKKPEIPPNYGHAAPVDGCQYVLSRGDNKGDLCGKKPLAGYQHCRSCLTKKKPNLRYQPGGDLYRGNGAAPSATPTSYTGSAMPNAVQGGVPPPRPQEIEFDAAKHPSRPGLVVLVPLGYVIEQVGETVIAHGMHIDGKDRPMTQTEIQEAQMMCMQISPQANTFGLSNSPAFSSHPSGLPQAHQGGFPQAGLPQGGHPQAQQGGFPQAHQGGFPQAQQGGFPQAHQGGFPQAQQGGLPQAGFPQAQQGGLPQVQQPQAGLPQVQQPQVGLPQAGLPQAGLPQVQQPQAGLPQAGLPQVQQPQAGLPQAGLPQVQQQQPQQPQAGLPQAGLPQVQQQQPQQPQAGLPQAGLPQVQQQPQQPQAGLPQAGLPQVQQQPQQPQAGLPQAGLPQVQQPQQPQAGLPQAGLPQVQQQQPQAGLPQAGLPQVQQPQGTPPPESGAQVVATMPQVAQ